MFKRALLITVPLLTIGSAAFATGDHYKDKEKDFKPCKLEQTDSPRIHNKHCKPPTTPTPVITPKVTPTSSPTPKAPTSVSPKPPVTPAATPAPVSTPAASQTVKSAAPAVLPAVGGSGRQRL